jgi:hypothetical protein
MLVARKTIPVHAMFPAEQIKQLTARKHLKTVREESGLFSF